MTSSGTAALPSPVQVAAVTGSRADFGLLEPVLRLLAAHPGFRLEVVPTGMHLASGFGLTVNEVVAAGFAVPHRVETLLAGDGAAAVSKAIALGVIGFADLWSGHRPDLVLVLGDRFEIFAAVQAAYIARIPIAHLCGGDLTEGAFDDALRHAMSKMASLHFVTNAPARERLLRMGEQPERVHVVGSPGLDALQGLALPDRAELEASIGFRFRARNLLVTFHPVTLDPTPSTAQMTELLAALDALGTDTGIVITLPNADTDGRALIAQLEVFAADRANVALRASLGHRRYLGLAAQVDAVVGNSSSGLYEIPSLHRPTVNIGMRQRGRLRAASVIDCAPEREAIGAAIVRAYDLDCSSVVNPYGDGQAAPRIVDILSRQTNLPALTLKEFYDG